MNRDLVFLDHINDTTRITLSGRTNRIPFAGYQKQKYKGFVQYQKSGDIIPIFCLQYPLKSDTTQA